MKRYLVKDAQGKTIFQSVNERRAEARAKATPDSKLLRIPATR